MISGRGRGKIRPPRRNPIGGDDSGDFETQWEILKSALREIHHQNASTLSFEQIYRASYKLVLKKQGGRLYDQVQNFKIEWLREVVLPPIRELMTKCSFNVALNGISGVTVNERRLAGDRFLKCLKSSWEDHHTKMKMIADMLIYMDRVYCVDNGKPHIFISSIGLFRDHILRSSLAINGQNLTAFDVLNSVLLDQISMERDGDIINKTLIRSCIEMLESLYEENEEVEDKKLYLTGFEDAFLSDTRKFYQKECEKLLRNSDTSLWLRETARRLEEEKNRCQTTISILTQPRVIKVVETEMISARLSEFIAMEGSGMKAMIENDRLKELKTLYELVSRVDCSKTTLKDALQSRVVELGSEINKAAFDIPDVVIQEEGNEAINKLDRTKAPSKHSMANKQTVTAIRWVDQVLKLKDKFDKIWAECFDQDLIVQTALSNSFSHFINLFPRCSEYLSLLIDDNLKSGVKGKTETEIDSILDKAVILLRYIQDKDIFERYYKKHLARRLLHKKSESGDIEKQMISRMKQEIGNTFTSKLEGMFRDMTLSDELSSGYRSYAENNRGSKKSKVDLGIIVLTTNFWPVESMGGGGTSRENGVFSSCIWPKEILEIQESFKAYYLKERNGRRLTWLGFLGSADIRCYFPPIPGKEGSLSRERRYELVVSTYGMLVLLLFNRISGDETLSFEEIQEQTKIPVLNLSRILYTLSALPKCRIKVPVMVGGGVNKIEGDDERKETEGRNDEHRGNVIDTVIVRIMKSRKKLAHQALVSEVIGQLSSRFKPDISLMKRRIESLIEREYLERVENSPVPTYSYMA
ncbi:putative cullin-3 [Blumeria hordei DH14]|uniref:Putative cullin-3 n=1 Tax=Blumeria graminis f. sp. hordei (strain DH14) TaxID=546991 RepID=N1J7C3_BLUG1|nr:putative cullin-3 [Blumeria hordei DH14]